MTRQRLEAFTDAVIAIVMTIMVLEMKVPHGQDWTALAPLQSIFVSYIISFAYLGIYWNNHHHMMHMTQNINGRVLWANLVLLFWLSLIPFVTGWMGENHFAPIPTALYGTVLLLASIAYFVLQGIIIRHQGADSPLKRAVGKDLKGKISVTLYVIALPMAFVCRWIAIAIYVIVALIWFVPDDRIERSLARQNAIDGDG